MVVIRLTVAAITVSALCVVAPAQEGKTCPTGYICPVCSEENGVRTCRVERPGQPTLAQAAVPAAPRYLAAERQCAISTTRASGISIRTVCYPLAVRSVTLDARGVPNAQPMSTKTTPRKLATLRPSPTTSRLSVKGPV
jgi:hypothetical protein